MLRDLTQFVLAVVLATAAGAQPAVVVLPQPPLDPSTTTLLELRGPAGTRPWQIELGAGTLPVPVGGPPPWTLRCADPALWCQDLLLTAERAEPWPFPIFQRARLSGRLPASAARGADGRVVVQGWVAYVEDESPMLFVLDLAVEQGGFAADVPFAIADLRIAVPGAAPIYRWGVEPNERGAIDLGELDLAAGGSLSGFLVAPDGGAVAGGGVVIEPLSAAAEPSVVEKLSRLGRRTEADEDGFFQLLGIPPGRYRLIARGRGLERTLPAIEIEADGEVHLRRLELHGGLTLAARLVPPTPPEGGLWGLRVLGSGPQPIEREVSASGETTFRDLAPGAYEIAVVSPAGEMRLVDRVAVLADTTRELRVDQVRVDGSVRLGREPLVARVVVETGRGDSTSFESGGDGRFGGWLPAPHRHFLRLRVLAPQAGLDRTLELAGADVVLADDLLRLDLDLSQRRVHGRLIDDSGQPVADASVEAWDAWLPAAEGRTDDEGHFGLEGLEAGSYWITARHSAAGAADPVRVELRDEDEEVELLLAARPLRTLAGSLVAADGLPVAGAKLSVTSVGSPFNDFVESDASGRFAARVVAGAPAVSVVVLAPSRALWAGCRLLTGDDLTVRLPPGPSGRLRIVVEGDDRLPPAAGNLVLVSESGGVISADVRSLWGEAEVQVLGPGIAAETVTALAPGQWAAGLVDEPGWKVVGETCGQPPGGGLASRTLLPSSEEILHVDLRGLQEARLHEGGKRASR